jgi:hypothetical protein
MANPQSWNRYTYVLNSPLVFIDPSGHAECGDDCNETLPFVSPPYNPFPPKPPIPAGPIINFTVVDDCVPAAVGACEWTQAEMDEIMAGALEWASDLAAALNGRYPNWNLTPEEAFLLVYGQAVTFQKVGIACADDPQYPDQSGCGARTISSTEIRVYSDAQIITNMHTWAVHELAHAFVNAYVAALGNNVSTPIATMLEEIGFLGRFDGFAGSPRDKPRLWQQSNWDSPGEEFADMGIGWAYGQWADDDLGPIRADFMTKNMPRWIRMIVSKRLR